MLPGLIAFALYREQFHIVNGTVQNGDIAYPMLIINLLPAGLVGIMIAALMAALMGAMSSVFNSASTLVTLDFYKKIKPTASERQLVTFGRYATGALVILGVLWVPFIKLISAQLFIYLQAVQAYISPPIAVCFILGITWPRMNGKGALSSLLSGFVFGSTRFIFEVLDKSEHFSSPAIRWLLGMNFLLYAVFMFIACAAIMITVSLLTPAPEPSKLAGLTFATAQMKLDMVPVAGETARAVRPPYESRGQHNINLAMSGLLLLTVISLWIYFR